MDKKKIEEGVRLILEGIGEDIQREGLLVNAGSHCQNVRGAGSRLYR